MALRNAPIGSRRMENARFRFARLRQRIQTHAQPPQTARGHFPNTASSARTAETVARIMRASMASAPSQPVINPEGSRTTGSTRRLQLDQTLRFGVRSAWQTAIDASVRKSRAECRQEQSLIVRFPNGTPYAGVAAWRARHSPPLSFRRVLTMGSQSRRELWTS